MSPGPLKTAKNVKGNRSCMNVLVCRFANNYYRIAQTISYV